MCTERVDCGLQKLSQLKSKADLVLKSAARDPETNVPRGNVFVCRHYARGIGITRAS